MVPRQQGGAARISVETEEEVPGGWLFVVRVEGGAGLDPPGAEHRVRLAWVDYEHWSHGTRGPSRVVEEVLGAVVEAGVTLPARFDLATCRRWVRDLDERMRAG